MPREVALEYGGRERGEGEVIKRKGDTDREGKKEKEKRKCSFI